MSRALKANYRDRIRARFLSGNGVADGGALVDYLDAVPVIITAVGLFPFPNHLDVFRGVAPGRFYHRNMCFVRGFKEHYSAVRVILVRQH